MRGQNIEEIPAKSKKEENPPLKNIEAEREKFLNELEYGIQPIEEKKIEPLISQEVKEPKQDEAEGSAQVEEKPPMFFSAPKRQVEKTMEKPRVASPFVTQKPNPASTQKPFVDTRSSILI